MYVVALDSRLYGEKDATHLKEAWVPLLYTIVKEGSVFNWSSILSLTIMDAIARVRYHTPVNPPEFYMSSYLIYIVCAAANHFPGMGWKWAPTEPPVQVYCQDLWEHKYIRHYTRICDHFMAPLYTMIFCKPAPRLSEEAIQVVSMIRDWYVNEDSTYIRIYGATKAPHLLPRYSQTDWSSGRLLIKQFYMVSIPPCIKIRKNCAHLILFT